MLIKEILFRKDVFAQSWLSADETKARALFFFTMRYSLFLAHKCKSQNDLIAPRLMPLPTLVAQQ